MDYQKYAASMDVGHVFIEVMTQAVQEKSLDFVAR